MTTEELIVMVAEAQQLYEFSWRESTGPLSGIVGGRYTITKADAINSIFAQEDHYNTGIAMLLIHNAWDYVKQWDSFIKQQL